MGITEYLKENLNESKNPNRTQKGINVVIKNIATKLRSELGENVKVIGNRISVDLKRYREYNKSDGFINDKFVGILERMYTDLADFIQISVEKKQLVIIVSAINESSINEGEFKVGDYISKRVKVTGGQSGTEGWIVNIKGGFLQIADEYGGFNEKKWHEPKGFKLKKNKSKEVNKYKPLMDLIKKLGGSINEASIDYNVDIELSLKKEYNSELERLSKGGKITDKIRIQSALKVYDKKVFTNNGITYKVSVNKKAKNTKSILDIKATKGSESQTTTTDPNIIDWVIG